MSLKTNLRKHHAACVAAKNKGMLQIWAGFFICAVFIALLGIKQPKKIAEQQEHKSHFVTQYKAAPVNVMP
jgi:hypothetical protein